MTDREITIGELSEDVRALTAAIERLNERIETTYVRKDVYEIGHKQMETDIAGIDGRLTWASRTAIGALLFPLLVIIVAALVLGKP